MLLQLKGYIETFPLWSEELPECVSIGPFDFQQQEQLRQQQEQLRQQEEAAAAAAACLPGNEIMPIKMEVKSEAETDTPAVSTTKPEASTGDG